jgi:hypothetical protein
MKKCSRCFEILENSFFYFDKKNNTFSSRCKSCTKQERKDYYRKNNILVKDRRKKYYEANKDIILKKDRAYKKTPEAIEKRKHRYEKNIESHRQKDRERYRKSWIKRRLSQIKSKCISSGIEFDLTEDWVTKKLNEQNWKCYWSGVFLDVESRLFAPSFDRIIPGGPYTKNNVVMSCFFVNMGRNNAEMGELVEILQQIKNSK